MQNSVHNGTIHVCLFLFIEPPYSCPMILAKQIVLSNLLEIWLIVDTVKRDRLYVIFNIWHWLLELSQLAHIIVRTL